MVAGVVLADQALLEAGFVPDGAEFDDPIDQDRYEGARLARLQLRAAEPSPESIRAAKASLRRTVLATGGIYRRNDNGTVTMRLGRPMSMRALAALHVHGLMPQPLPVMRPKVRARRRRATRTAAARRAPDPPRPRCSRARAAA